MDDSKLLNKPAHTDKGRRNLLPDLAPFLVRLVQRSCLAVAQSQWQWHIRPSPTAQTPLARYLADRKWSNCETFVLS